MSRSGQSSANQETPEIGYENPVLPQFVRARGAIRRRVVIVQVAQTSAMLLP
jgi:hypothetical protein